LRGHSGKNDTFHTNIQIKWTKIGVDIGICLDNNQDNFQLHSFTRRENTAKSFRGKATFLTHTVYLQLLKLCSKYDSHFVFLFIVTVSALEVLCNRAL